MNSTKNKAFKTSWSKFEAALDNSFMYEARPKTSASSIKSRVKSNRLRVFNRPSPLVSKSCYSKFKRPIATKSSNISPLNINGIDPIQLESMYDAKCHDLGIPTLVDLKKRFFESCKTHFFDRKFDMRHSGLGPESAKKIGEILKGNNEFAYINLSKNLLKDEGVYKICKQVSKSLSIVHFDISSNEISPEGIESLLGLFMNHMSLVSLDLSSHEGLHRNRLAVLGSQSVSAFIKTSPVLAFLNLAGTGTGPEGLEYIIKGLKDNLILLSLNLSNNNLGSKIIEKLSVALATTNLKELILDSNKIGNEGVEYLSTLMSGGYEGYCTLMKLDISRNEITTVGLSKIFASLRINTQLKHLNIKYNDFSRGMSSAFNQFLIENIVLEFLDTSNSFIICEGIDGISEALGKNNGLKYLYLNNNMIKDKGAEMISNAICKNKVLKVLDLSSNKIKDKGGLCLAKAVSANDTLEVIQLKNNSLKDDSGSKFSEIAKYKHNLLKIGLELNPMNLKYLDLVKFNLKNNYEIQQRKLVPELQQAISKIKFKEEAVIELKNLIVQKQTEKAEIETKLVSKETKLDQLKEVEESKLEELKAEYISLRELSLQLSIDIEKINTELNVKFI
jgi:Leucine Rich repeat